MDATDTQPTNCNNNYTEDNVCHVDTGFGVHRAARAAQSEATGVVLPSIVARDECYGYC